MTQATLSVGIQERESILGAVGAVMVDRNRSGMILTAAGVGDAGAVEILAHGDYKWSPEARP